MTNNQLSLIPTREAMVGHPEVQKTLSQVEVLVAQAGTEVQIREVKDRQALIADVDVLVKYIARDLGIRSEPDKYDKTRFFEMLHKYYSHFSIRDVKLAFEFYMSGELDEWLPTDRDGNVTIKHYGQWSLEFASGVLRAYKSYRSKTWCKVHLALPDPTPRITATHRKEYRRKFLQGIVDKFRAYRDESVRPNWLVRFMVIRELHKLGYTDIPKEPTPNALEYALNYLQNNRGRMNPYEYQHEIRKYEEGTPGGKISHIAEDKMYDDAILSAFDQMIRQGIDIEDLFVELGSDE